MQVSTSFYSTQNCFIILSLRVTLAKDVSSALRLSLSSCVPQFLAAASSNRIRSVILVRTEPEIKKKEEKKDAPRRGRLATPSRKGIRSYYSEKEQQEIGSTVADAAVLAQPQLEAQFRFSASQEIDSIRPVPIPGLSCQSGQGPDQTADIRGRDCFFIHKNHAAVRSLFFRPGFKQGRNRPPVISNQALIPGRRLLANKGSPPVPGNAHFPIPP